MSTILALPARSSRPALEAPLELSALEQGAGTEPLLRLGRLLNALNYRFTTVTPTTHQLVNARVANQTANNVSDVFGWSRPFHQRVLPTQLFELMRSAGACKRVPEADLWQPLVRFSTLNGLLFAHSAFPTVGQSAVFFGPDSYRFVRAIEACASTAQRVVDVGCGSGVGGIALAQRGVGTAPVVLADINHEALRLARVNAELAGVRAETVESDVLCGVHGEFDLVIANPPYLRDTGKRVYREGGGEFGEQLALRIVRESIERLGAMENGGRLLLYTGAAVVHGEDTFFRSVEQELSRPGVGYSYQELDPDIFSEELHGAAYASAERIAAVLLQVQVARASA